MSKRKSMLEKISDAKRDITEAQIELESAIGGIQASPRAQKKTISKVVENALTKLRAARIHLEELEKFAELGVK